MARTSYRTHLADVVRETGTGEATKAIVALLEQALIAEREAEQAARVADGRPAKKVNPWISDVGKCQRAVWRSLRNEPETHPLTTDSLMNFAIGRAVEEAFADRLHALGAEVLREIRVELPAGQTVVSGRADFFIAIPDAKLLIELKSTSSRSMGFMLRNGEQGRQEHRDQLGLYLHASQLGLMPHAFDVGQLVYLVKDATRGEPIAHAWPVPYNRERAEYQLEALGVIDQWAKDGIDPGIPANFIAYTEKNRKLFWMCQYCSYQGHCWIGRKPRG